MELTNTQNHVPFTNGECKDRERSMTKTTKLKRYACALRTPTSESERMGSTLAVVRDGTGTEGTPVVEGDVDDDGGV